MARRDELIGAPPIPRRARERWDQYLVMERMVEGFRTLRRAPAKIWPRAYGNAMPPYLYEWSDFLAQAETTAREDATDDEKERIAMAIREMWDERNLRRLAPTSVEIARMNQALAWPMLHLNDAPLIAEMVNGWSACAARGRDEDMRESEEDFSRWCERRRRYPDICRAVARIGMDLIAIELNRLEECA